MNPLESSEIIHGVFGQRIKLQNGPLISIITPSLNSETYIAEAIESVLSQDCPGFEHIIMDGGSTDGTLEILRTYSHLRVISEPDKGLYHALNKGILLAKGAIVGWLNSDDFYEKDIFNVIIKRFANDPALLAIRGGAIVFEDQGNGARRIVAQYTAPSDADTSFSRTVLGVPVINTYFFRKDVYDQIGLYDTSYRIAADRDFILRATLAGVRCSHMDRVVYRYRQHPGSLTISRKAIPWFKIRDEHLEMAENYMSIEGVLPDAKSVLKLLHSREASEGVLQALKEMRFMEVLRYGMRGQRYDTLWLKEFVFYLCHIIGCLVRGRRNE